MVDIRYKASNKLNILGYLDKRFRNKLIKLIIKLIKRVIIIMLE